MEKIVIKNLTSSFEEHTQNQDGLEFWYARDLQKLLEYADWRNFLKVIEKAKESCENADSSVSEHFVDINKMVTVGSGAEREIEDILLTRYACYLVAQNADPQKQAVAFAQSYFALQTRKQELIEERIKLAERLEARERLTSTETQLSKLIYERGIDEKGFGRIRSKGDKALFGGYSTQEMKEKMNVPVKRALGDFLPTVTILAKALATEMTNMNIQAKDLEGEKPITQQHISSNLTIRQALANENIIPENLPAEEDIKKLERRIKSQTKKSLEKGGRL
ncbi:MAG: DNA damage-inducible protein D [Bacteroidetes bacterium]|nr:MAG: DNA damage-inducible protein D [Bacteroidota bacterium]TAG85545.1 MAG: DNA damage-inducible protein D [Bacteroidota bacterium]